jgi:hypothetical protein
MTVGYKWSDGLVQIFGVTDPKILETCRSRPEDFWTSVAKWNILSPDLNSLDLTSFTVLTESQFGCVLNFKNDYIEVATLGWALKELFVALKLKLKTCSGL